MFDMSNEDKAASSPHVDVESELRAVFEEIDADKNGRISLEEFQSALAKHDLHLTQVPFLSLLLPSILSSPLLLFYYYYWEHILPSPSQ